MTWRLAHRNFRSSSRGQFKPRQEWEWLPAYLRRNGHAWCDFLDQKSGSILGALRVEVGLKVHPALHVSAEVTRQPQRGVRADAAPFADDFVDAGRRHAKRARRRIARQSERFHEFFALCGERKARVMPGLLVVLPLLVPLLCVYGPKRPVLTSVLGLLCGCGAIYALASVARGRGKKLEEALIKDWGGMPTTIALRHRDAFLDSVSKQRYHAAITAKLGIAMPAAQEESADPLKADDVYGGATKRLRELTRGDKQLLLKENIAYGFHRNMLAMKPVGIVTCLFGIVYGLLIANVLQVAPAYFLPSKMVTSPNFVRVAEPEFQP